MKKKPSVYTETWLIGLGLGLALVLPMLFGRQTTQAQDVNTLPSFGGWVGAEMPYKAWTATMGQSDEYHTGA
jgi:hypothetical protein